MAPPPPNGLQPLAPLAARVGSALRAREQTLAIAEGSCGGLVSAALVAVPGASHFFAAGAVLYTRAAFRGVLGERLEALRGLRGASEPFSLALAREARAQFGSDWALGEAGASGPSGNRYGDPAGHVALAVAGPVERARVVETGLDDREANMWRFAEAALSLLAEALDEA